MKDSKGKGRATANEDGEPNASETPKEPSLLSRVAASAVGLTRNTFARPNGDDLIESAAAAMSESGKGQSSRTIPGQGSWVESSKLGQTSQANGSSALRSRQSEAHVKQSENDFSHFLDGIDNLTFATSGNLDPAVRSYEETTFEQLWARSQLDSQTSNHNHTSRLLQLPQSPLTVDEQGKRDGDEVLALLSGPMTTKEQFEAPEDDEEYYDWGLSQDQIIELKAMMKEIFPDSGVHVGIVSENPLNLVPMSDEHNKLEWFEQWEGVLNRYADEVWGGLLPLVKEARNEVDELWSGASDGEPPKALRRLKAILGHLQQR